MEGQEDVMNYHVKMVKMVKDIVGEKIIVKEDLEEINDEGNIEGNISKEVYNDVTKGENEKEEEGIIDKSEEIYEISNK